jgi:hypothetical protein
MVAPILYGRRPIVATTAVVSPALKREEGLEVYIWLEALSEVARVLIETGNRYGDSPGKALLPAERSRLFELRLDSGIGTLGFEECSELWPGDLETNPEYQEALKKSQLLTARLLIRASESSEFFTTAAADKFEGYHAEANNA